ncbi:MAG: FHA domain-containing protein [Clostridiaceae bacterium]|nr:FHA domain-containing protein [Eubacteriales bacterium]
MQMKQCENGHFYDASKFPECPYCAGPVGAAERAPGPQKGSTVAIVEPQPRAANRTVAVMEKRVGFDPVVGWLVCMEGAERGRSFPLHADNNFIGRDPQMDVCLSKDDTVSAINHAIVSFDARDAVFYFSAADGRSIVRHNDKAHFGTAPLKAYDRIEIGSTKLVFVPLCGENFQWTQL